MKRKRRVRAGLIAVAVLALLAAGALHLKGRLEERSRRDAEVRGSALIGGEVQISQLHFSFFPPTAHLEEVHLSKTGNRGSRADAFVPAISITTTLRGLLQGGQDVLRVEMARPRIELTLAEEREWFPGGAPAGEVLARSTRAAGGSTLEVTGGRLNVAWGGGPKGSFSGIRIEATRETMSGSVSGRLEFGEGRIMTAEAPLSDLRGDAAFNLGPAGLWLEPFSIRGEGVALSGAVNLGAGGEPRIDGSVQAGFDAVRLATLLPESAGIDGRLEANLSGSWLDGKIVAQGDLSAIALSLWGLQVHSFECDVALGQEFSAQRIRAHLFGGQATGSLEGVATEKGFNVEIDLRVDGVDLHELLEYAGWTGPELRGTSHYRGRHQIDSSGIASLRGSGVFDAVGHYRSPGGPELPLEVTARLETRGDVVRLRRGAIRAGAARGAFSGSVSRGVGVRLRLDGAAEDNAPFLPLFRGPEP